MNGKAPEPKKWMTKLTTPQGTKILLVAGLAGIGLIFLSEVMPRSNGKTSPVSSSSGASSAAAYDDAAYTRQTEQRVSALISSIEGVGKAEVMVTFENGVQNVYEQQQKQNTNRSEQTDSGGGRQVTQADQDETSPVVVNGDGGAQQPVLQKQVMPSVRGIVVVCDGGDRADVQEKITNALTAAFSVPANHVFVTRRGGPSSG